MTTKRPLQQSDKERVYVFDKDYRCVPWFRPDHYDQSSLTFKKQPIAPPVDQNTNAHNEQSSSQSTKEDIHVSNKKPIFPDIFPVSLTSIIVYIVETYGDTYIPPHSTIPPKKRRRMLYLPLEFGEVTMD